MNRSFRLAPSSLDFGRSFLNDPKNVWVSAGYLFLLLLVYVFCFRIKENVVFPDKDNLSVVYYTDKDLEGHSYVLHSTRDSNLIEMRFVLKQGYIAPYAGMELKNNHQKWSDISLYNRLELDLSATGIKDLVVYLATKDKNVKDTLHKIAERHLGENIQLGDTRKVFNLNFKTFKTADWWFNAIGQPQEDFGPPEWDRCDHISLATGTGPRLNKECELVLHGLRFYRDNTWLLIGFAFSELLLIILLAFWHYRKWSIKKRVLNIHIKYEPVEVGQPLNSGLEFLDYIQRHFSDSELSLSEVAKQTGINARTISETISEKFQCNFKTYVNLIRVAEAKRLLKETDLNSGEVAYKVGFSSAGSFNRVFKTLTGKTPTEYSETTGR